MATVSSVVVAPPLLPDDSCAIVMLDPATNLCFCDMSSARVVFDAVMAGCGGHDSEIVADTELDSPARLSVLFADAELEIEMGVDIFEYVVVRRTVGDVPPDDDIVASVRVSVDLCSLCEMDVVFVS